MKFAQWRRSIASLIMVTAIAGCTTAQKQSSMNTAPEPVVVKTDTTTTEITSTTDNVMYYPVNDPALAQVAVEKIAPDDILANKAFDYTIKVHNLINAPLGDVVLKEHFSDNFELIKASPEVSDITQNGIAQWDIGKIGPNETREFQIQGKAVRPERFKNCATVSYEAYFCHYFNVSEPELLLQKFAQERAYVDEVIPVRLIVSNPGTGIAKNVVVTDPLPAGMVATNGQSVLKFSAGDLASNQSKEALFAVQADHSGTFDNVATATADGLSAKANAVTVVTQPKLKIVKTATEKQYRGRNIDYSIKVTNIGDGDAVNTVLSDPLPQGTSFVRASNGGTFSANQMSWNLGTLAPNASKSVGATVKALNAGTILNTATAQADRTGRVSSSARTVVSGVSALLLEVIDTEDPLEVGGTGNYVITVTNQGTAEDTNIKVELELESNMTYVTASGPTPATISGNKITFAPLASLDSKSKAAWTVSVNAVEAGDVRSTVRMNSDQLSRPVMETEATTIY